MWHWVQATGDLKKNVSEAETMVSQYYTSAKTCIDLLPETTYMGDYMPNELVALKERWESGV